MRKLCCKTNFHGKKTCAALFVLDGQRIGWILDLEIYFYLFIVYIYVITTFAFYLFIGLRIGWMLDLETAGWLNTENNKLHWKVNRDI